MTLVLFAGPTLWNDRVRSATDILWCPPAAQGDVYRAARAKPLAIGLIDGAFESQPSVWHKEILWAMSRGVRVYGAASMGALRAAELAAYGMIGVGRIFRAYRLGQLRDDDEVAVLHAPEALHFRPLSEAMVDIRATIAAAVQRKLLSTANAEALVKEAKALFFKDRSWANVLQTAPLKREERARLERWLRDGGRIEQKRRDAHALIRTVRLLARRAPGPHVPSFAFPRTVFWDALVEANRSYSAARRSLSRRRFSSCSARSSE